MTGLLPSPGFIMNGGKSPPLLLYTSDAQLATLRYIHACGYACVCNSMQCKALSSHPTFMHTHVCHAVQATTGVSRFTSSFLLFWSRGDRNRFFFGKPG
jgi:hypothetical protein